MHHFNDLWQLVASCGNLVEMCQVKTLFIMCNKKIKKIFMQNIAVTHTRKKNYFISIIDPILPATLPHLIINEL